MDFSTIRPVISGLAGGLITYLLMKRWGRSLPAVYASKPIEQISKENKAVVSLANGLFFIGLAIGIGMYQFAGYDSHDWTPLCVGFGFASVTPVLALLAIPPLQGKSPKEAFVAFSIGQGVPNWATYGSLGLGVFAAIVGTIRLVT